MAQSNLFVLCARVCVCVCVVTYEFAFHFQLNNFEVSLSQRKAMIQLLHLCDAAKTSKWREIDGIYYWLERTKTYTNAICYVTTNSKMK